MVWTCPKYERASNPKEHIKLELPREKNKKWEEHARPGERVLTTKFFYLEVWK